MRNPVMVNIQAVKRALSSVKVYTDTACCYIELTVPVGPDKESISFIIKVVGSKLEQVVADVTNATGVPAYSGFIANGGQPNCPVYKHT
jgi:hypothetical protein